MGQQLAEYTPLSSLSTTEKLFEVPKRMFSKLQATQRGLNVSLSNFPRTLISYADMATLLSASLGFLAITYIIDGSEKSYIVAMLILPFVQLSMEWMVH